MFDDVSTITLDNCCFFFMHIQLCFRQYNVMFKADNVLRPEVVQEMFKMTKKMREVIFADKTWQDICLRVPVVATPTCFDYKQSNSKDCKDYKMPNLSANDIRVGTITNF